MTQNQELQLELTDHTMKEIFNIVILVDFYKPMSADKFPCVKKFAGKMLSILEFTYICEQSISGLREVYGACQTWQHH